MAPPCPATVIRIRRAKPSKVQSRAPGDGGKAAGEILVILQRHDAAQRHDAHRRIAARVLQRSGIGAARRGQRVRHPRNPCGLPASSDS